MTSPAVTDDQSVDELLPQAIARARARYADGVEQHVGALSRASWGLPRREAFGEWLAASDG